MLSEGSENGGVEGVEGEGLTECAFYYVQSIYLRYQWVLWPRVHRRSMIRPAKHDTAAIPAYIRGGGGGTVQHGIPKSLIPWTRISVAMYH